MKENGSFYGSFPPAGPRTHAPGRRSWLELMQIACNEASNAACAGEVPVGALVVAESGEILAKAGNRMEMEANPCAHAEMLAIQAACRKLGSMRLKGSVLVCTLEPCLMCAAACAHAHMSVIVYGASDPVAGAVASCHDFGQIPLGGQKIWHMGGILGRECAALLNDFFRSLRSKSRNDGGFASPCCQD